jgi:hypothetical protein
MVTVRIAAHSELRHAVQFGLGHLAAGAGRSTYQASPQPRGCGHFRSFPASYRRIPANAARRGQTVGLATACLIVSVLRPR